MGVHRPAVISVNMFAASLAVNEFVERLKPCHEELNHNYAAVTFSLASMELIPEGGVCKILTDNVGKGDGSPLLGLLGLAERQSA